MTHWIRRVSLVVTTACVLGLDAHRLATLRAAPASAPVLDVSFATVPHRRAGSIPAHAVVEPVTNESIVLNVSPASGLRALYRQAAGTGPSWASLPHGKEAYLNADAIADLGINLFLVQDDTVLLTASSTPVNVAVTLTLDMKRSYLSGLFNMYLFDQASSYFDVPDKMPKGCGIWPAFWLFPIDYFLLLETGIVDILGNDTHTAHLSIYTTDKGWISSQPGSDNGSTRTEKAYAATEPSEGFYRYDIDWASSRITLGLDNTVISDRPTSAETHKPFCLVVDLVLRDRGSRPGLPTGRTHFPASLAIRSIRIWSGDAYAG